MAKPFIHAKSSVKKFGGRENDYLEIHNLLDSSKSVVADNRHRVFTHNSWFVSVIIERIFGITITNSDGKEVSTREIAEQHILEDFGGFIPSGQDFLEELDYKEWMNGNGLPASRNKLRLNKTKFIPFNND